MNIFHSTVSIVKFSLSRRVDWVSGQCCMVADSGLVWLLSCFSLPALSWQGLRWTLNCVSATLPSTLPFGGGIPASLSQHLSCRDLCPGDPGLLLFQGHRAGYLTLLSTGLSPLSLRQGGSAGLFFYTKTYILLCFCSTFSRTS